MNMKKIVFFVQTKKAIGGSQIQFLDFASYIARNTEYEAYYINHPHPVVEETYVGTGIHFEDVDNCDYSQFEDALFFTPINYLFYLLAKIRHLKNAKICLYVYHPDVLDWLNAQVPAKDRDMESLCQLFLETNSYCFMDLSNYLSTKRRVDLPWQERYVPVTVHTENTDKVQSVQPVPPVNPDKPLQVGWLGRLDNDKIHSMLNVAENLMKDSTVEKVDFHVIGDGNAKRHMSVANYSPKIRFILTSYLYAEERNNYIRDNVDIMVAMGISAIDTAMLGVPTVIPIVSPKPFWTDSFVYVQDLNKYSLGWNIEDDSNMGCITHSFHEVVEDIRNGKKLALGEEGRVFCGQTFSLSAASMELLKCLEETELTVAKCMAYPSVQKEMKTFDWYRRLRLCRDFPEFHEAVARMNRAKQKSFKQKFKTLLSKILKKLRGQ